MDEQECAGPDEYWGVECHRQRYSRKGSIVKGTKNRPDLVDRRPKGVLFSTAGQTGWKRRRDLTGHKAGKKEGDFQHLHAKFADPEDAA